MRAALARLLLAAPDVLVLDEPTNHLDTDSVAWLEQTLRDFPGAVLFVSHDRDFIDAVADHVIELANQSAVEYVGGFAEFVVQREERLARIEAAAAQQQRQVDQVERFVERFRYKATKARQVQSRIKTLEKLDRIEVPERKELVARFGFPEPQRSSRVVVEVDGATVGYDGEAVLSDVDLVVERGHKLAVVGPNGAGKSTLLRLLVGELEPDGRHRQDRRERRRRPLRPAPGRRAAPRSHRARRSSPARPVRSRRAATCAPCSARSGSPARRPIDGSATSPAASAPGSRWPSAWSTR